MQKPDASICKDVQQEGVDAAIARSEQRIFKPRARLLLLLGDQLIRDPGVAVFELVKNAYDADSPSVTVTMTNLQNPEKARIVVKDEGQGMDWKTVTEVWLEPGTDNRAQQRARRQRTPVFKRLPLGEKGVGRFAAHKLGEKIRLITRAKNCQEVIVDIDWASFEKNRYLADAAVTVTERDPRVFRGEQTGTRIEITGLRHTWTSGMVRDVYRAVMAICPPFAGPDAFRPTLVVDPPEWLEGLAAPEQHLEHALFRAECKLEEGNLTYTYEFQPLPGMTLVGGRAQTKTLPLPADANLSWSSETNEPLQMCVLT